MKILILIFLTLNSIFAIEIFDVTPTTAKINITNLNIGHTGVILKKIDDHTLIVKQAEIVESNNNGSVLKFLDVNVVHQEAIPTTKLLPQNGDQFILNHLYTTSLLIVPNNEAKNIVKKLFPSQNFLDEDFFASHLKVIQEPVPNKKTISKFATSQQIGTVFIVASNKLYILDSITFKVINTMPLNYEDTSTNKPFLTKITNIEQSLWNFGDKEIKNYNTYYTNLVKTN